jgi:hypothetical protein
LFAGRTSLRPRQRVTMLRNMVTQHSFCNAVPTPVGTTNSFRCLA